MLFVYILLFSNLQGAQMEPLHHLQLVVPQDHAKQLVRMSKYCPGLHQGDVAQLVLLLAAGLSRKKRDRRPLQQIG